LPCDRSPSLAAQAGELVVAVVEGVAVAAVDRPIVGQVGAGVVAGRVGGERIQRGVELVVVVALHLAVEVDVRRGEALGPAAHPVTGPLDDAPLGVHQGRDVALGVLQVVERLVEGVLLVVVAVPPADGGGVDDPAGGVVARAAEAGGVVAEELVGAGGYAKAR
jgi:hypothetical protein